ncbi:glycosyl transferase family 39 [Bifidobacterium rousetti]|uniref:ArnT family glycosyltransferase n=1 Tax=Bifidobacterium rousetti TaxID=2045439 RepID=UPI0012390635|nr:glycosyltransferase family 39 protein [Bifidobacterium rousetti]KAA8820359.1 glycosyl transferase family 39 [Bifidobacterium rousetti]
MTISTTSAAPSQVRPASSAATAKGRYHRPDSGAPMPAGRYVDTGGNATVRSSIATRRTTADWIGFGGMMTLTAVIMFVNLTASGYANEFYSAAAQAGSQDWWAFLWGSLDSGNAITVDKPPAAIWLMALSIRVFGLNSFAILLPEALCGMASVWILYTTVRRAWGNWAGVIAGLTLATTPVAALMFRFNNPDALLVLLMTGATAAVMRALEYPRDKAGDRRRTLWMILAGVCIGFGFLTKQMQVFLVVPGFALAFLVASPTGLIRRIVDGLVAVVAVIVSAGWWIALTVIVPSGSRPYIGGSQTDSFLELTFGYNGLGRLTGNETGAVVGGGGMGGGGNGGGMWGQTGLSRLFDGEYGGQIAWLAPIAFAGIVIGLIVARRSLRTDLRRANVIAWGSWLVVTWLTFSFMAGIFHQYYTVALAPAVAALVAIAVAGLWSKRKLFWARGVATALVLVNTFWAVELLGRSTWLPWLKYIVMAAGLLSTLLLVIAAAAAAPMRDMSFLRGTPSVRRGISIAGAVACALATVALAAGPLAWTAYTVSTGHTGSIVTAGPNVTNATGMGGGPGGGMGGPGGGPGGSGGMGMPGQSDGSSSDGQSMPAMPGQSGATGESDGDGSRGGAGGRGGMGGGLLGGGTASDQIVSMLQEDAGQYRWAAATTGSQNAASYQLASEQAVMAIGGFNGSDPAPTLEQFKSYVEQGLIHYYISGGGMGGNQLGGSDAASEIASWVAENFEAQTVDGVTIYDLTD